MLRALILAIVCTTAHAQTIAGWVTDVHDGDTIEIERQRVRIAGMATPYLDQPHGSAAHGYLLMHCYRAHATGKIVGRQEDGTLVADISCHGTPIAEDMIRTGNAWPTIQQYDHWAWTAKVTRQGMWSYPTPPTPPWLHRR
jgi:endonuclease YncB( thermonuclease family)